MILNEYVNVKICYANYKHYESKGYTIQRKLDSRKRETVPDQFVDVKWSDIPHGSNQKIKLKCDICGKIFERKINLYYLSHESNNIDACSKKCQASKSGMTKIQRYGTINPAKICQLHNKAYGRPKKHNLQSLNEICSLKGYILCKSDQINDDNITVRTKLDLKCIKHNTEFNISVASLGNLEVDNCPHCIREKSQNIRTESSIEEVKDICIKKGYELLTDSIDNCDSQVLFICKKHKDYGIQSTSLYGLKNSIHNCRMCWMPKKESHWNWKGGVTSERDDIKHKQKYQKWIKDVFERDNYTCQCCGARGVALEAHHIYNFSDFPELRTELSNGITLCHNCHSLSVHGSFHSIYTQFHNTPEQLDEYIKNYRASQKS